MSLSPPRRLTSRRSKVKACGVCGTDLHIHEGEFIAKFPLIPGHECVGVVAAMGKNVKGFQLGERVVADNSVGALPTSGNLLGSREPPRRVQR